MEAESMQPEVDTTKAQAFAGRLLTRSTCAFALRWTDGAMADRHHLRAGVLACSANASTIFAPRENVSA
jgi:hypothetical protein